jgi:hydrogenase small subunit
MAARTEIDVLWVTAGLGCDGDTIAMTAATQPSLEDLIFGALPFVPRIKLHNPFLAYENGEEFMEIFHRAAEGGLTPFILVIEGSIPNEKNKREGSWPTLGTAKKNGQPILNCE